jgi:hypothetical protein
VQQTLWQPGYWERVLRAEEDSVDCALYIFANPVRRGLARSPAEYPYSGGTWFARATGGRAEGPGEDSERPSSEKPS